MNIKPDGKGPIGKELAILLAGFIPITGVTIVTGFGVIGFPVWVIIWALLIAGDS